mmetsp:Transcript_139469/g.446199  ORF Transcript_139469/g.446199 Transcript_139469/m.446199 type:complete len:237 (-) Transcript_139469:126-836(-)
MVRRDVQFRQASLCLSSKHVKQSSPRSFRETTHDKKRDAKSEVRKGTMESASTRCTQARASATTCLPLGRYSMHTIRDVRRTSRRLLSELASTRNSWPSWKPATRRRPLGDIARRATNSLNGGLSTWSAVYSPCEEILNPWPLPRPLPLPPPLAPVDTKMRSPSGETFIPPTSSTGPRSIDRSISSVSTSNMLTFLAMAAIKSPRGMRKEAASMQMSLATASGTSCLRKADTMRHN